MGPFFLYLLQTKKQIPYAPLVPSSPLRPPPFCSLPTRLLQRQIGYLTYSKTARGSLSSFSIVAASYRCTVVSSNNTVTTTRHGMAHKQQPYTGSIPFFFSTVDGSGGGGSMRPPYSIYNVYTTTPTFSLHSSIHPSIHPFMYIAPPERERGENTIIRLQTSRD